MNSTIEIHDENGIDNVIFKPKGVCCRLMTMYIKDDVMQSIEFTGGCSGNITGIGKLVRGMKLADIINELEGILCGSKGTSCPDQLTQGIKAYLEAKSNIQEPTLA